MCDKVLDIFNHLQDLNNNSMELGTPNKRLVDMGLSLKGDGDDDDSDGDI